MNKKFIFLSLFSVFSLSSIGYAQQELLTDQNPNSYKSKERYLAIADSLMQHQGTTVQQTYKAYDWYQAREERRALRRERRHQERLNNPYNDWYYPSFGVNYIGGYNNWGWSPYIGFNTGRHWFGY